MKESTKKSFSQKHTYQALSALNKNIFDSLFKEISLVASILIASFIASICVFYLFPKQFVLGYGDFFERLETLKNLSGWYAFKNDIWRFPLLNTRLINIPDGVNIAFTNTIPLAALLLKPFRHWLSKDFHYFGMWVVFSYFAQSISATLAIRSLGQQTILATIAAASMSLMMPILLWQTDNIALISQAYLFFGFALYFTGLKKPFSFKEVIYSFTFLLLCALLTNPYLPLLASIFYIAFLYEHSKKTEKNQQNCVTALITTSCVLIAAFIAGGYFNKNLYTQNYSDHSINLVAFVSQGNLSQTIVQLTSKHLIGINALGVGILASLLLSIIANKNRFKEMLLQHHTLISLVVLFTLFSISSVIFASKQILPRYSFTCNPFFWPFAYTLMLLGLTCILSLENKQLSILYVSIVLMLQFYDTMPFRNTLYRKTHAPSLTSNHWNKLVRSVASINLYPAYGCGSYSTQNIVFWQTLAARNNKAINTAHVSNKKINCAVKQAAFNKPLNNNQLYITSKDRRSLPHHISSAMDQSWCRKTDKGILCVKNTDYDWWRPHLPSKNKMTKQSLKNTRAHDQFKAKKKKNDWGWPDSVP